MGALHGCQTVKFDSCIIITCDHPFPHTMICNHPVLCQSEIIKTKIIIIIVIISSLRQPFGGDGQGWINHGADCAAAQGPQIVKVKKNKGLRKETVQIAMHYA